MIGANQLSRNLRTWTIEDKEAILDENDEVITPATTELTDFFDSWSTLEELDTATLNKIVEKAGIVQWEDPTDDLLEQEGATDVKDWTMNQKNQ